MKTGYTNLLIDQTFSGGSNPTYAIDNDSLKVTTLNAAATLTITLTSPTTLEFLSIFNYDGTNLQVVVTKTVGGPDTTNLTTADATGFQYNNYLVDLDSTTTTTIITIKNTGASAADIGYVWAGAWIDFGCAEAFQPFDESADDTTVDRTNRPLADSGFLFQAVNITTKKLELYTNLRTKVRKILETGFSNPRPFLFNDGVVVDELMYGILGSGRIGYDFYQMPDTYAQISIEIRETT
jgi:hypothetical protein